MRTSLAAPSLLLLSALVFPIERGACFGASGSRAVAAVAPTSTGGLPPAPDAELVRVSLRGGNLHAEEQVRVTVEVRNAGNAPMPPVPVVLTVDGRWYGEWTLPEELDPGEQATWETTFSGSRGMHLLAATADPLDNVREVTKANNTAFVNIGLGDKKESFPWLASALGVVFFLLGMGAGSLLRRPPKANPRKRSQARPAVRSARPPEEGG